MKKKYVIESTGEEIFLSPHQVWCYGTCERLMGLRNTAIYMLYRAYCNSSGMFHKECEIRNIKVIVITEGI